MFLEVFEQILNACKGLLFEASVKTHGREEGFEICQKAQKQKNSNSEIGSSVDRDEDFGLRVFYRVELSRVEFEIGRKRTVEIPVPYALPDLNQRIRVGAVGSENGIASGGNLDPDKTFGDLVEGSGFAAEDHRIGFRMILFVFGIHGEHIPVQALRDLRQNVFRVKPTPMGRDGCMSLGVIGAERQSDEILFGCLLEYI